MGVSKNKHDLYEVIGVAKDASQAEIRKAYLKLSLKLHPDRNPSEDAKEKFQSLQQIYSVLSDPEKRKIYDETGSLEDSEDLAGSEFDELFRFYRGLYKTVDEQEIDAFTADFRGSEEERRELLKYYEQFHGNMDKVFEWLMCSDPKLDSHRFMDAIEQAIKEGQAKGHPRFTKWAKQTALKPRPKNPLAQNKKRKKAAADDTALVAQIRGRQGSHMGGVLAALGAKYGVSHPDEEEEPTEEEFTAARKRLAGSKAKQKGKEAAQKN